MRFSVGVAARLDPNLLAPGILKILRDPTLELIAIACLTDVARVLCKGRL